MPGITGRIGGKWESLGQDIDQMLQPMMHEAFYGAGAHVSDNSCVGLGATFQPKSFTANQPFWNQDRTACLVFAGECFGLREMMNNEDKIGDQSSNGAGSVLSLYDRCGIAFLEKLNGIFSGAIADFRQKRVFLFNDRFGLGRIYFHQKQDTLYFASEAKALLNILPKLRQLDLVGLAEQLCCGCTLEDRTLFREISLLPGGSVWSIAFDGIVTRSRYFNPSTWEAQDLLNEQVYQQALQETFSKILPRYLEGNEAIGMSLTGGLDGRMIMAHANPSSGNLPCYTFGGSYRDCADVRIGKKVAEARGFSHEIVPVGNDFLREFPALAEKSVYLSDGTMEVSGAVELYVNRLAREIAPVRLTGNYGSEILRRNVAFKPSVDAASLLSDEFADKLQTAAATYRRIRDGNTLSFIAFKQIPWHHYARLSLEQSQLVVRSPYLDNEIVSLAYRAPASQWTSLSALHAVASGNQRLGRIPTDRGLTLTPQLFVSTLLRGWQEFLVRAEYAYDYGMPQSLARADHALASLKLERLFLGRHKFYHFRIWYRNQLAPFVREVLLDPQTLSRPYLRRDAVERTVHEHVNGLRNHTTKIHKLLTTELILRKLLRQSGSSPVAPSTRALAHN